jgi:uncharacterized protein YndB with AHSA1/START domain
MQKAVLAGVSALLLAGAARAEIIDQSAAGFEIRHAFTVAAPASQVYAALLKPNLWWSSANTWSGSAAHLRMDLKDHCFCETLPKGEVRHMEIVYQDGGQRLHLSGALGPGQFTGATGHLDFAVAEKDGKTTLTATYDVGGYAKGGLAEVYAKPFDAVLGEQVARLHKLVETGKPD